MNRRDFMTYAMALPAGAVLMSGVSAAADTPPEATLRRWRVPTRDGLSLNVVDAGDPSKPAIVFVHGLSQSSRSWQRQLESRELRAAFRLIAVDLRGHGESQGACGSIDAAGTPLSPRSAEAYVDAHDDKHTSALWACDIQAVLDGLQLKDPSLVGWSYGAVVVLDFIRVNNGLGPFRRAVLTGGSPVVLPPGSGPGGGDLVFAAGVPPAVFPTLDLNLLASPPVPAQAAQVSAGMTAFVELMFADAVPGRAAPTREEIVAAVSYNLLLPPVARQAIVLRNFDFRQELAALPQEIRGNVQIVTPLADQVIQSANTQQYWEAAGLGKIQVVLPDEGHAHFARNPVAFNARLREFFTS